MKRTMLALGLAALAMACFSSHFQAQTTTPPAATRVAIVNVGLVFSKYEKAKLYKAEMEAMLQPFRLEGEKLKKEMLDWAEAMKHPKFDLKERDRYEQGILANKRKLEDLDREARKLVGKKQEDQIVTLYKDVANTVQAYAQANGIHLVLAHGEQIEGDLYAFPNINRKMQGMDLGSTSPMFFVGGVDISQAIADTLNAPYRNGTLQVTPVSGQKK